MISLNSNHSMLGYESLDSYSNISHFVTTRQGGCGEGLYGSFNCSPYCGDDADVVRENQERLMQALPRRPHQLIIPQQNHGIQTKVIDEAFLASDTTTQQALLTGIDALITHLPGYCLCISTADCIPILLYDNKRHVIAAIHAGWRGTVHHIVAKTLQEMQRLYGTQGADVWACIGPGISLQSFEVGAEVYETFRENGFDMSRLAFWKEDAQKHHIDLCEANRLALLNFGIPAQQIETAGVCTYIEHEHFFSARRLGIKSGRILSGIMIH